MRKLVLFVFIISFLAFVTSDKTFVAKVTGIKCQHDKQFVTNVTCKVKAVKGKQGPLTMKLTPVKDLSNMQMQVKLYYKFGNAIYREWMINVQKDLCVMIKQLQDMSIERTATTVIAAYQYFHKHAPTLMQVCPYKAGVEIGAENLEFDSFMPSVIPQLIPDGDYRTLIRIHTRKNETIILIIVTINIQAIDKIKAYDMG